MACALLSVLKFCNVIGLGYLPTDVLPPPSEEFDEASGIKKLIEYKFNEDGKKVKVLMAYFPVITLKMKFEFSILVLKIQTVICCIWYLSSFP